MSPLQRPLWFWLFCCLQLFFPNAWAHDAVLDVAAVSNTPVSLTRYFSVLEDPSRKLTLRDVQSPDVSSRFMSGKVDAEALSYGYTQSMYWFRLVVRNSSNQPLSRMLELANARLSGVTLHLPDTHGDYQSIATGMAIPFNSRPHPNRYFVFPLQLSAQSEQVVYLQMHTSVPLVVPAKLWQPEAFYAFERSDYITQSMYFGMILAMVLFNLLLFWSLRDGVFVYYVLFVLGNAMAVACMNGLAKEWLWPQATFWADVSTYVFYIFASGIGIFFSRRMLSWPELYPRFDRFMLAITCAYVLLAIGLLMSFLHLTKPAAVLMGVNALLTMGAVIHGVWRNNVQLISFLLHSRCIWSVLWLQFYVVWA